MTAFRIVEHLDVVEDVLPGVIPGCIGLALDALTLQQLEEAFSDSIVVTVSTSAHACFQPMRRQEIAPVLADELQALIRMNHHKIVMAQERLQWSWRFSLNQQYRAMRVCAVDVSAENGPCLHGTSDAELCNV